MFFTSDFGIGYKDGGSSTDPVDPITPVDPADPGHSSDPTEPVENPCRICGKREAVFMGFCWVELTAFGGGLLVLLIILAIVIAKVTGSAKEKARRDDHKDLKL